MLKIENLKLHLLDPMTKDLNEVNLVESAFKLWERVWKKTWRDLNCGNKKFNSDDFMDRELIALFNNNECVSIFFTYQGDFKRASVVKKSYFNNYSEEALRIYSQMDISGFMSFSYMTIHEMWRKSATNVPLYEVMFSLAIKRFMESNYQYSLGYIRTDLSFHNAYYDHGAIKIHSGVSHNVTVDYCYIDRNSMSLSKYPGVVEIVAALWETYFTNEKTFKLSS